MYYFWFRNIILVYIAYIFIYVGPIIRVYRVHRFCAWILYLRWSRKQDIAIQVFDMLYNSSLQKKLRFDKIACKPGIGTQQIWSNGHSPFPTLLCAHNFLHSPPRSWHIRTPENSAHSKFMILINKHLLFLKIITQRNMSLSLPSDMQHMPTGHHPLSRGVVSHVNSQVPPSELHTGRAGVNNVTLHTWSKIHKDTFLCQKTVNS